MVPCHNRKGHNFCFSKSQGCPLAGLVYLQLAFAKSVKNAMSEPNLVLQNLPAFSRYKSNGKILMCSAIGVSVRLIEIPLCVDKS